MNVKNLPLLRGAIVSFLFFTSPLISLAATTPLQSEPPVNLGWGVPVLLPWPDFSGTPNGFTLIASSTQTFNQVTLWTCSNNRVVSARVHVYKGELDNLVEVASSTSVAPNIFCPSNLPQRPWLITGDEYRFTAPLQNSVQVDTGERLTVFVDFSPYNGGYLLVGAHPARSASDFITMASTTAATLIPPDPVYPYFPSFELAFDDGCVGQCVSNVLFLPGIEGSRLYRQEGSIDCSAIPPDTTPSEECFHENQLWEPNRSLDVEKLFLTQEGKADPAHEVYTRDVIDEVNVLPLAQGNIYKSFLNEMKSWETTYHITATTTPYDWRLSLNDILSSGKKEGDNISYSKSTTTPYIIQELRDLAATSKTGKVTIIAHSNGGLVTKALTNMLGAEATQLIDKIIFVAVPQTGTPQAIGALLHGYDQGLPKEWFPIILDDATARTFASTSPMTYHLLPSSAYFNGDGNTARTPPVTFQDGSLTQPFITAYGHGITTPTELHNFLLGGEGRPAPISTDVIRPSIAHPDLLAYGESTHQNLDDNWVLPPSISLAQIAGWGNETLGSIDYSTGVECVHQTMQGMCLQFAPALQYTPSLILDGDGTVVTPSALAMSTSSPNVSRWWVNLAEYNKFFSLRFSRDHKDILEVPELRTLIKNVLTNTDLNTPLDFISTSTPHSNSDKRLFYFLHSPLALSAHTSDGGEISAATSTIPGAEYRRFGEVQYISVLASSSPQLVLTGLAQGSFTLEVQEGIGDTITATTTFAGIPSSTSTKVTMDFPDGTIANASPLAIDENGDGQIDFALTPKVGEVVTLPPVPTDTTPPEAIITFSTSTNTIFIKGIDESGTTTISSTTTFPQLKKNQKQYNGIATTIVTIKDTAGNTNLLVYTEKLPSPVKRDFINLVAISYNGATSSIPATLKYAWGMKNDGTYKKFVSTFSTSTVVIESHYRPKKNITVIMQKPIDMDDSDNDVEEGEEVDTRPVKTKIPGFIVPSIITKQGKINLIY